MSVWGEAVQVFLIGFGTVLICLFLLQISISIFLKIVQTIEKKEAAKPVSKS
ncbi:MAG: OadG family protein [Bacillota bacterium]|nr:OadG family protein [Bacillota bacterium]